MEVEIAEQRLFVLQERLSPEERSELRTLLRERHREMRERHPGWRPDDGR